MEQIRCDNCGRLFYNEEDTIFCPYCEAPVGAIRIIDKETGRVLEERLGTRSSKGVSAYEEYLGKDVDIEFYPKVIKPKYSAENPYMGIKGKIITILLVLLTNSLLSFAQKKPTLMILPSDNWCTQRYFYTEYDNQGNTVFMPNYQQAFQEDLELGGVISKVGELMTNLGYSLKDAEMELKNINQRTAEDNVTFSKTSGAQLNESPLDMLKRRAKADIIIQLGWVLNQTSLTFTLEAFDAYTSKRIATATGTSNEYVGDVAMILQRAVEKHIKSLDKQLDAFYKNMERDGREIILTIRTWDSWENDLESEFGGDELLNHIQMWMQQNCVKGRFNLSDASENFAQFEQVKIPLKDNKGMNMDARSFARGLQKHLNKAPFNITSKLMMRGLGEAILVLGEK